MAKEKETNEDIKAWSGQNQARLDALEKKYEKRYDRFLRETYMKQGFEKA